MNPSLRQEPWPGAVHRLRGPLVVRPWRGPGALARYLVTSVL